MDTIMQILSLIGAFFILAPFAGLSMKKMEATSFTYNFLNFIGAIILTVTATYNNQYGFILLEAIWSFIGLKGMISASKNQEQVTQ